MKWQRKGKKVEYCIRLDDACPQMNAEKWARIERILDKYKVKPIVGVIPENRDPDFVAVADETFGEKHVNGRKRAGRSHCMVYITNCIFTSPEDTTSFRIPVKQNGQGKVVQNSMKC